VKSDLITDTRDHRRVSAAPFRADSPVSAKSDQQTVIVEMPIAMVYNGISTAVMMATPNALEDFGLGFSLSEGIIDSPEQLYDLAIEEVTQGISIEMTVSSACIHRLKQRRRTQTGKTGCGLCGVESLDQAIDEPSPVVPWCPSNTAIQRAVRGLQDYQPLQQQTGGGHAAAFCSADGDILLIREDVGRHNALDKLIGAYSATDPSSAGFILMSSRASYELVDKTCTAGISALVTLSAPTSLAIDHARSAGLSLIGFARSGRHTCYNLGQSS